MQTDTLNRWIAAAGQWAQFIKPSLLATAAQGPDMWIVPPHELALGWVPRGTDTAVIVDLPAFQSISVAAAFSRLGWCVVPMFNTTAGLDEEIVPTVPIMSALIGAADGLHEAPQGPPVFLLDSERSSWRPIPKEVWANGAYFENRWFVFAEDFPTAASFASHGIKKLLVVTRETPLKADLRDALARHSELQCLMINPGDWGYSDMPKPRPALVRGVAKFTRKFDQKSNGSFGYRIAPRTHG